MRTDDHGQALVDVMCALALVAILCAFALPVVAGPMERERAIVGAQVVNGHIQHARFEALRRATSVALQIDIVTGRTSLRLFVDGNGNGVLQRDINLGVDYPISGTDWIDQHVRDISLRINQPIPDIGGGASLKPGDNPMRIGRTSLLAFSPMGNSTSGTLYIAATAGPQMAVRLYGATGRTRVLTFNAPSRQWDP